MRAANCWFYEQGRGELYDVVNDVGETNDLSNTHKAEVRKLRQLLRNQLEECRAQVPTRKDGTALVRP